MVGRTIIPGMIGGYPLWPRPPSSIWRECPPVGHAELFWMYVEKDWEARFAVPSSMDRKAIVFVLVLFAILSLPLLLPVYIFLLVGFLPAVSVSFIMRRRKPLTILGIVGIAISVWATLLVWWVVVWGNKPCDPFS
jgi:hypothetical protein